MWIYVGWYIVLSGARLAYAVEHADFHDEFRDLLEHPRSNELIASRIAEEVARTSLEELPPPTSRTLALSMHLPEQRVRELVQVLVAGGLLIAHEKGALVPARDVATLTLADISAAVGGTAKIVKRERASSTGEFESVARLFTSADETTVEKLKAISWADLVRGALDKSEKA
jgi:membrane protein